MYAFVEIHGSAFFKFHGEFSRSGKLSLNDDLDDDLDDDLNIYPVRKENIVNINGSHGVEDFSGYACFYRFKINFNLESFKTFRIFLLKNGFNDPLKSNKGNVDLGKISLTIASEEAGKLDDAAELATVIISRWGYSLPEKIKEHAAIAAAENAFFAARECEDGKR